MLKSFGDGLRRLVGAGSINPSELEAELLANPNQDGRVEPSRVEPSRVGQGHQTPAIPILILGRFGSPKTKFINAARATMGTAPEPVINTIDVSSKRAVISGYTFKLIDTPGFDDPHRSNVEIFENITNYLLDKKLDTTIAGIIYVHHAGDSFEGRALRQIMNVLSGVILGRSCLSRLTILVVPADVGSSQYSASVATAMEALFRSTFRPAREEEIRTMVSSLEETDITNLLMWYASKEPIRLRVQLEPPRDLRSYLESGLGYYETDSMKLLLDREKDSATRLYHAKLVPLESALNEHKSAVKYYEATNHRLEYDLTREREETLTLRQKLQQTQAEYASLRSQLQLQENIEQSEVVQVLKDLNRSIDDIGRSFAAYLVDNYVQGKFDKDPGDVTTLDAEQLPELKELFGHTDGQTSLVASSEEGMNIEEFFDYAIRCLLCVHLCGRIFRPFHPGVEPTHNKTINIMYDDIQQREPQAVSAKWRANCFKSIYRPETPETTVEHIDKITRDFFDSGYAALIASFFGKEHKVVLDEKHFNQLNQLVQTAWDWNATLKGEVIVLGDFYQTCYDPKTPFDPICMEEFEPRNGVKVDTILGTLALGLISTRAVGGGQPPQYTVVCKAMVATEGLYH